jgi:hypothetical protein
LLKDKNLVEVERINLAKHQKRSVFGLVEQNVHFVAKERQENIRNKWILKFKSIYTLEDLKPHL